MEGVFWCFGFSRNIASRWDAFCHNCLDNTTAYSGNIISLWDAFFINKHLGKKTAFSFKNGHQQGADTLDAPWGRVTFWNFLESLHL